MRRVVIHYVVALVGSVAMIVSPLAATNTQACSATKVRQGFDLSIDVEVGEPSPNPPSLKRRYIKLLKHGPTVIDLGLGEAINNGEVNLTFRDNSEYRMFQRYRTSMSVSVEGPHLDLMDWRHFDSPWIQLKTLKPKQFQTLSWNQMDHSRFPPTTNEEIMREVRKRVGSNWPEALALAKDCDGPNDGACLVSISSIYLRIQKRVAVRWIDVGRVEIRVPMGC